MWGSNSKCTLTLHVNNFFNFYRLFPTHTSFERATGDLSIPISHSVRVLVYFVLFLRKVVNRVKSQNFMRGGKMLGTTSLPLSVKTLIFSFLTCCISWLGHLLFGTHTSNERAWTVDSIHDSVPNAGPRVQKLHSFKVRNSEKNCMARVSLQGKGVLRVRIFVVDMLSATFAHPPPLCII